MRILLHAYWLVSGYGLRASRALAVAMGLPVVLMMLWGLPNPTPKQTATGTMAAPGSRIHLVIDKSDPVLTGPLGTPLDPQTSREGRARRAELRRLPKQRPGPHHRRNVDRDVQPI
ncbi:hypothetical protein QCN29_07265 [Streptomyces sp. HNM0663]|uniref:Uncharacterized protein n=1 Tax=Streptomyces chengmaiensis TaxID=3040919 RepID=A0ABT6HIL7_9ACTN|nr:hypothetical protein [Streptomyces chengmaiensis]MDH2388586.1 hypothetical protein [Streptomyces chengmaiensis]